MKINEVFIALINEVFIALINEVFVALINEVFIALVRYFECVTHCTVSLIEHESSSALSKSTSE